ncbi:hypothetical protein MTO96_000504 [Rhipicephalus appendiculatus]
MAYDRPPPTRQHPDKVESRGAEWSEAGERPSGRRRLRLPPSLLAELLSDTDSEAEIDPAVSYRGFLDSSEGPQGARADMAAQRCLENAAPVDRNCFSGRGSNGAGQSPLSAPGILLPHETCQECGRAFKTKGGLNQHRRHKHLNHRKHESNRRRKKRVYAETQRLFKKAQNRCARKILDGAAKSNVQDPEDFLMAWRRIMEIRPEGTVSP